jgi:hypothetical protein
MPYPNTKLWDLLKPLANTTLKIYKEHQDEDNDKKPSKYVVIQEEVYDETLSYGDGTPILREATFEIYINSKKSSEVKEIYNNIASILISNGINYNLVGNIYDTQSKYFTRTIEGDLTYHV